MKNRTTEGREFNEPLSRKLRTWIASLLPEHSQLLNSTDSYHDVMKSGVILCELLNTLEPGLIKGNKIKKSKSAFQQMENIDLFLTSCKNLGIDESFLFVTVDLFEQKNLNKTVDCICEIQKKYALEEYKKLRQEAHEETNPLDIHKEDTQSQSMNNNPRANHNRAVTDFGGLTELELKKKLKYTPQLASAIKKWIEELLKEKIQGSVVESLKNGVILCNLLNKLKPGTIEKIYEGNIAYRQIENISNYLNAVKNICGFASSDIFDVADLFNENDIMKVLIHLNYFARWAESQPNYEGPIIEDTTYAENMFRAAIVGSEVKINENEEEQWTEEEKKVIDWANLLLSGGRTPMKIRNLQSLRSGIKILELIKILTELQSISHQVIENPTTILHFINNESIITGFLSTYTLETIDISPGDIATANREALFRLLLFIQRFDYDIMYQHFVENAPPADIDLDITEYLPDEEDNESKMIIQEVIVTARASSTKGEKPDPSRTTSNNTTPNKPTKIRKKKNKKPEEIIPLVPISDTPSSRNNSFPQGKEIILPKSITQKPEEGTLANISGSDKGSSKDNLISRGSEDDVKRSSKSEESSKTPKEQKRKKSSNKQIKVIEKREPKRSSKKVQIDAELLTTAPTLTSKSQARKSAGTVNSKKSPKRKSYHSTTDNSLIESEELNNKKPKKNPQRPIKGKRDSSEFYRTESNPSPEIKKLKIPSNMGPISESDRIRQKKDEKINSSDDMKKKNPKKPTTIEVVDVPCDPDIKPTITATHTIADPSEPPALSRNVTKKDDDSSEYETESESEEIEKKPTVDQSLKFSLNLSANNLTLSSKLHAQAMMRKRVAEEILSTELSYLKSLSDINKEFITHIRAANWFTEEEFDACFSNLEQILENHQKFLSIIQPKFPWSGKSTIGKEFLQHTDFLEDYKPYLLNFNTAVLSLEILTTKKQALMLLIQGFDIAMSKTSGYKVADILIMPVQRIPRYIMLLSQLQKFTLPGTSDYKLLETAGNKIKSTLEKINSQIQLEGLSKLEEVVSVRNSLVDCTEENFPINLKRELIKEGPLVYSKNSNPEKKKLLPKKVHSFLFSDYLLICLPCKEKKERKKIKLSLNPRDQDYEIMEGDCRPEELLSAKKKEFVIKWKNEELTFETKNEEETKSWVSVLFPQQ